MSVFGLDVAQVGRWFRDQLGAEAEVTAELIVGGRSNLTYRVHDGAGRRWVLRRPPLGVLAGGGAHDVVREARIMRALTGGPVPTPRVCAVCVDESVIGAPFIVLEYVDGVVLRQPSDVAALPAPHREQLVSRLVDALVTLHQVDPDDVGLGDLGRREAYLQRQLRRWMLQSQAEACADLELIADAHAILVAATPAQRRAAIVHGDFRLENCIIDEQGRIRAILDWEICTLGDPLADVGMLLAYWGEPGDEVLALEHPPTLALGVGGRDAVRRAYGAAFGLGDADLDYYEAFGWWKLACIVGGVHARVRRGAVTLADRDEASFREQAARTAKAALARAQAL